MSVPITVMVVVLWMCLGFGLAAPGQTDNVGTILIVVSGSASPYQSALDAMRGELEKSGRTSIVLSVDELAGDRIEQLHTTGVRYFAAIGSPAAVGMGKLLPDDASLAYCLVPDPADKGLTSRSTMGGVPMDIPLDRQFELMGKAVPRTRTVGMLYRSSNERSRRRMEDARAALPSQWRLAAVDLDGQASVAAGIEVLMALGPDFIWTTLDPSVYNSHSLRAVLLAGIRGKVPVFGFSPQVVRAGALVGVGVDPGLHGRACAAMLEQAIGGVRLRDQHPEPTIDVAVNLVIAKSLDIDLPADLVDEAQYVFDKGP